MNFDQTNSAEILKNGLLLTHKGHLGVKLASVTRFSNVRGSDSLDHRVTW